jgi:hypothetical protein
MMRKIYEQNYRMNVLMVFIAIVCVACTSNEKPRKKPFDCADMARLASTEMPFDSDEADSILWVKREYGVEVRNHETSGSVSHPVLMWESAHGTYVADLPERKFSSLHRYGAGFPTVGELTECIGKPSHYQFVEAPLVGQGNSDLATNVFVIYADAGLVAVGRVQKNAEFSRQTWMELGVWRVRSGTARDVLSPVIFYGVPDPVKWPESIDQIVIPTDIRKP